MNRTVTARPVVAGLLALGVLGAGVASAATAAAVGEPTPRGPQSTAAVQPANQLITARADATTVKAWQQFRVQGKAQGVKPGYTVLLQQKQGASWKSLPVSTTVNRDGSYSLRVKLGVKGKNQLRTITGRHGDVVSQPMSVVVR
ncbi:hypothetical protein DVA86_25590 [Streptomyces armeniacus]|uniref:Bacterial Ig domain-containing protein n=1 Tax=Streptomyces armeniacus TaxID=83291 RepID=A0A345XV56_9ACTN|nr:hypothetical protein [Streptomyces armeniacus]AXK35522.1 hypothetical protein DVA86_25590 [Streptomyces armeniacus]